ncbi:MAG: GH1 family beta-glucosidase [Pseudomonadota bacterium]
MDEIAAKLRLTRADFPKDFVFGTATSAYQIEGTNNHDGAGLSHWDTFAATPGNTANFEDGSEACDHYTRWAEDLDLIRDGGFDAYRFSTSWARIEPDGPGAINNTGLDFYDRLVDGMLERGIEPWLTLYHWELPAWLATRGGWQNRETAERFGDFADIVSRQLGDRLTATATINEPWCVAWLSHFYGAHAPGLRDIRAAGHAMHHVLLAHAEAMEVLRANGVENLGIVLNLEVATPATNSAADQKAAQTYDGIYNRWFLSALFGHSYPDDILEGLGSHLPDRWQSDMDAISKPIDWLGLNYYTRKHIAHDAAAPWPACRDVPHIPNEENENTTAIGWEIYPNGLRDFLVWARDGYSGDTPIYITENGLASDDIITKENVDDPQRIRFLNDHWDAMKQALQADVPVKGYFVWSLLDNYEWALGYDARFGIVHVDRETFERTPKSSWRALKTALQRG